VVRRAGERKVHLLRQLIQAEINSPLCSSAGRLFDAVAALLGLPGTECTTYEGQAAMELELAAHGPAWDGYPFQIGRQDSVWVVSTLEVVAGVVEDLLAGRPVGDISSRFHRTMAEVVVAACQRIRRMGGTRAVALSGGTFQNMLLLQQAIQLLEENGFTVYRHCRIPANDGGLSLGQAVLADSAFRQANG
jgi:hydrogenase maturation protein HypF